MQPLEFLAAVLPSAGVYCVAELSSKNKEHVFATTLDELDAALTRFNARKYNSYFALATFNEAGNRLAANARYIRALFVDLDCDEADPKKYANQQQALDALDAFLQETTFDKLGLPWIVSSGGGIHAYWPFEEHVSIDTWKPVAENFKRLAKKHDLKIDFTVTADAARVLRVPGSTNWKQADNPRPVKILQEGGSFSFDAIATALREKLNGEAVAHAILPGKRPTRPTGATHVKLVENTETFFRPILMKSIDGKGCGQIRYYLENAADDGMEPLWRGLLSLAKVCADGDKAARKLSALHPYPEERMQQKLREIKGPYPCTKLDSENPGVCPSCPHWGKITNPLALGRETQVDTSSKEITAPLTETPAEAELITIKRPSPPRGFAYGKKGGVYREKEDEDAEGNKVTLHVMVLPYDLFVVDLLNLQGEHTVYMLATRPEGPVHVTLPQKAVVSKDETVKVLAAQNIVAAFGSGNDKNLFEYVRACVEEVSASRKAMAVPDSYGWQKDGSFVTASTIFFPDGSARPMPMPGLENLASCTEARGTLEGWRRIPEMLITKGYHAPLAVGLGVAFGAPLMEFAKGLHGLTLHAGSRESGTGKSVSLSLAASVWGDSLGYRVNPGTSKVAMQQRAGLLRSLPLVSDELTSKNHADFEWFPEFVFDIAEGKGKERMEAGANKERINTTRWSLLALVSSNDSALDYLSGGRKHSSEGEMRRMLEWTSNQKLAFDSHDIEILRSFADHCGTAGARYAAWLAVNRAKAREVFDTVYRKTLPEFGFTSDERYWHAAVSAYIAGYLLAGARYADIVDLPVGALVEELKGIVTKTRAAVKTGVRTAEDVLNSYIRDYYGKFVIVRYIDGAMQATLGEKGSIDDSITRSQVAGRVEHGVVKGHVITFIEEQAMKAYCSTMSYGFLDFKEHLAKFCVVESVKKNMLSKTKGPIMRVNALKISRPIEDESEEA